DEHRRTGVEEIGDGRHAGCGRVEDGHARRSVRRQRSGSRGDDADRRQRRVRLNVRLCGERPRKDGEKDEKEAHEKTRTSNGGPGLQRAPGRTSPGPLFPEVAGEDAHRQVSWLAERESWTPFPRLRADLPAAGAVVGRITAGGAPPTVAGTAPE